MLKALNQRKEVIAAKGKRKHQVLLCPGCHQEVTLRQGTKRQPHFAHQATADCQTYSEGETKEHLEAKQLLFEWFQDTGLKSKPFCLNSNSVLTFVIRISPLKYSVLPQVFTIS